VWRRRNRRLATTRDADDPALVRDRACGTARGGASPRRGAEGLGDVRADAAAPGTLDKLFARRVSGHPGALAPIERTTP
jgi:hypothetical protein